MKREKAMAKAIERSIQQDEEVVLYMDDWGEFGFCDLYEFQDEKFMKVAVFSEGQQI